MKKIMVTKIPITRARINLEKVVKRAHLQQEYFILEKDGFPVAGLIGIDEFEDYLELKDPKIKEQIRKGYEEYQAGKTKPLEEVLVEVRSSLTKKQKKITL